MKVLEPPVMKRDVCYWVNEEASRAGKRLGCVNAAVEATSLNDRAFGRLLPQDEFIRDAIGTDDVLVVSVGGNDVALSPLLCTVVNLAVLVCCVPRACLEHCACAAPPNLGVDCGCAGCGIPGCGAGFAGWPPGFGYVVDLFKNRREGLPVLTHKNANTVSEMSGRLLHRALASYTRQSSFHLFVGQPIGLCGFSSSFMYVELCVKVLLFTL